MKKTGIVFVLLVLLLLCCACGSAGSQQEETDEPTQEALPTAALPVYDYSEPYVRLMEPCGAGYIVQKNVQQTEVEGHTYRFEPSISEQSRSDFIVGQEALCGLLDSNGIDSSGLCFFVLPNYTNWSDSEKSIGYFDLDSTGSWKQAMTTLQLALGDYTNYGYLYALADRLAGELSWRQDETAGAGAGLIDGTLLNLVYPCFAEFYTSPEEIAACKSLSKELLAGLDDIWSEEAFLQARQRYADSKGIIFTPTDLAFAYYSPSCELKIRAKYLEIFRTNSFTEDDYYTRGYIDEDYMASLVGMIRGFGWLEDYLTQLRETFGVDDPTLLPVYLKDDAGRYADLTYSGYFTVDKDGGSITSMCLPILAHEYVHYLYWLRGGEKDPQYEDWINEVAACFYSLPADFEVYYTYINNLSPDSRAAFDEFFGKSFEAVPDLIRELRMYHRNAEGLKPYRYYLITVYDLRSVFGDYFVRTYGEEVFLDWALHPSKAKALTGKTTDEIVGDWCEDMDDPDNDTVVSEVFYGVNYGSKG